MFKRILFPTDGSDVTPRALQTALQLARLTGASIDALAAKEPFPYSAVSEMQPVPPQEFFDAQQRVAAARVQEVIDAAAATGVPCEGYTVERSTPGRRFSNTPRSMPATSS